MFYCTHIAPPAPGVKEASSAFEECAEIMERIRSEKPENWPHGLNPRLFDPDGLYMVRNASADAVGFTGWQSRKEKIGGDLKKVGYYSIGILPAYRGNRYATAAVSKLISEKSSSVDMVKAYIVETNTKSIALAKSLNIPIRFSS